MYRRGLVFALFGLLSCSPAYLLAEDREEAVALKPLASLPDPHVHDRTSCLNIISLHCNICDGSDATLDLLSSLVSQIPKEPPIPSALTIFNMK